MSAVELTLIIPVKDEEAAIGPCLDRVIPLLESIPDAASKSFEILFVDDGSEDKTLGVIRTANAADPRVRCISLSRNFGKEAALSAGLDAARGNAVVPLDVDLQDPPEALPKMIEQWRAGYDVVYGVRDNRETDSLPKRLTADLYYRAHNWLSDDKIPEHAGDFRLLSPRAVAALRRMPERNRFFKGLASWIGFKQKRVDYEPAERTHGKTSWNYASLIGLSIEGLTSFSVAPLRVASLLGILMATGALIFGMTILYETLVYGKSVPGYPSMVVGLMVLGGVQLIMIGVLGEYIGKILSEQKARPVYFVAEHQVRSEAGETYGEDNRPGAAA